MPYDGCDGQAGVGEVRRDVRNQIGALRKADGRVDVDRLISELVEIHANTYSFCIHQSATDWDDWGKPVPVPVGGTTVNFVGPFNRANAMVSTSADRSAPSIAYCNGEWLRGIFYLGTGAGSLDADSENLHARFHVGTNAAGQPGFIDDTRVDQAWNLWIR